MLVFIYIYTQSFKKNVSNTSAVRGKKVWLFPPKRLKPSNLRNKFSATVIVINAFSPEYAETNKPVSLPCCHVPM